MTTFSADSARKKMVGSRQASPPVQTLWTYQHGLEWGGDPRLTHLLRVSGALFTLGIGILWAQLVLGQVSWPSVIFSAAGVLFTVGASILIINYFLEAEARRERMARATLPMKGIQEICDAIVSGDELFLSAIWGGDWIEATLEAARDRGEEPTVDPSRWQRVPIVGPKRGDFAEFLVPYSEHMRVLQEEVRRAQQYLPNPSMSELDDDLRRVRRATTALSGLAKVNDLETQAVAVTKLVIEQWRAALILSNRCVALLSSASETNSPANVSFIRGGLT